MSRLARVVIPEVAHHVTQRGNDRRTVFSSESDRTVYITLLRQYSTLHHLSILGYCLMSNHVHLVVVPQKPESMALALRQTHGRYAACLNARNGASGHVWQGRYYSCALDRNHLWTALRYTERNPVRTGMVRSPEEFLWSSAAAHSGREDAHRLLDFEIWRAAWNPSDWRQFLGAADDSEEREADEIRKNTHTGRPLGTSDFVKRLELTLARPLEPRRTGHRRTDSDDLAQRAVAF
ncbi:MAG: transposase [Acidobacteria bacterium]|nr:transposase [Acidobacteriota bacterium]